MPSLRVQPVLALSALLALGACAPQSETPRPSVVAPFVETPCQTVFDGAKSVCGYVEVPENRQLNNGRSIKLNIVVREPLEPSRTLGAPLFVLAGGPGQGAVSIIPLIESIVSGARDLNNQPIVYVDVRGTGASSPLDCGFPGDPAKLATLFKNVYNEGHALTCLEDILNHHDLTQYRTQIIAEDMEAVRLALGFDQVDLFGISYGSRLAQRYLSDHPESTRAVILAGVVPPDLTSTGGYARKMERALEDLFDLCDAAPACSQSFDPRRDLEAVLSALSHADVEVSQALPERAELQTATLSYSAFVEVLRTMLYDPATMSSLPNALALAAKNDFSVFTERRVMLSLAFHRGGLAFGQFYSVTCSEDIPFVDFDQAVAEAEGTVLGDYRLKAHKAICDAWPQTTVAETSRALITSDVPALIFAGEYDPVTTAHEARRVAAGFENGVYVLRKNSSHSILNDPACTSALITDFLSEPLGHDLDVSCAAQIPQIVFEEPQAG